MRIFFLINEDIHINIHIAVKNRCLNSSEKCSHLCLLTPDGFSCACPERAQFRDPFTCDAGRNTLPKSRVPKHFLLSCLTIINYEFIMYMILKGRYAPCQVRVQILSQLLSFLENRVKKVVKKNTSEKRSEKSVELSVCALMTTLCSLIKLYCS